MVRLTFIIITIAACLAPPASSGALTLAEAEGTMLAHNPRIKAMEREAAMMKERVSPAGALDDPRLKLGVNNLPVKDPNFRMEDMTSKEIGISQMVPLGGKLSAKEEIALREYLAARERVRREKIQMLAMLRMAAYELAYARESIAIVNEIRDQVKLLIESEIAANKTGGGSLSAVLKANLEYSMVDEELITLRQREEELASTINYLTAGEVRLELPALDAIEKTETNPQKVKEELLAHSPELAILKLEFEGASYGIRLKEREYIPDMELGVSYMQRARGPAGPRDDMFSAMASVNVPLWFYSKNIPMVAEMKERREMLRKLFDDRRNELMARADTVAGRIRRSEALCALYKEQVIPQAKLALEAYLARYRTGATEFMPMVDTLRMLLRYRKEALMTRMQCLAGVAELKALSGTEVTE
ncbi:MAG: TolC family protein [Spirochaetes bacterium]|nr:MAG: TolC family protein [Spirochaetota bacterium]